MNLLSLDLELNKTPGTPIIQIGACVGSLETGEIIDCKRVYVKINEPLEEFIIKLTGITEHDLDTLGTSLPQAYEQIAEMHTKHQCFRNVLTWGGSDQLLLYEQLNKPANWVFGRRHIDVKTIYQSYCMANDLKVQSGLKKSCHKMGVLFEGPAHDGLQDAINTWKIFVRLLKELKH